MAVGSISLPLGSYINKGGIRNSMDISFDKMFPQPARMTEIVSVFSKLLKPREFAGF